MEAVLDTQKRINRIVCSLDSIATLPEITASISAIVHDPRSSASDLHDVIAHDPALVSRILKLVNSSFYGRPTKIDSVERAIVLLGFENVHRVALAATMGQLFRNDRICEGFTARDLWTHSVAVAVAAREMAKRVCPRMAEEVFLAGLVHDVGLLVLLQVSPDSLREVCETARDFPTPFATIELGVVGVDHQELGAALATKWGFPPVCRTVAAAHHHPSMADEEHQVTAALVHVADTLCCQERIGFYLTAVTQLQDEAAFKGLVPLAVIDECERNLRQLAGEAIRIFT